MRIDHINQLVDKLSFEPRPFFKTLQTGQVLNALVLGTNQHGLLQLKIGRYNVTANSASPQVFKPGETLKLIVTENREDVVLQVINKDNNRLTRPLVQQLLRNTLPYQHPPAQLLEKLNAIKTAPSTSSTRHIPQTVIQQIVETLTALSDKQTITTGQGLKLAIQNSGLFLEARLALLLQSNKPAQVTAPVAPGATQQANDTATQSDPGRILQQDLKAGLLRIVHMLAQSDSVIEQKQAGMRQQGDSSHTAVGNKQPPQVAREAMATPLDRDNNAELNELRKLVDAAIARIQLNQTNAIVTEESRTPVWLIDLPFNDEQDIQFAQLRISYEEGKGNNESPERKWQVGITLEIEELGKIHIRLTLLGETISPSVWVENEHTYQLISENIDQLSERLQQAGLNVDCINCFPGTLEQSDTEYESPQQPLMSFRI